MLMLRVSPSLQLSGGSGEEKEVVRRKKCFSAHLPVAGAHHDSLWLWSLHPHLALPALMGFETTEGL